MTLLYSADFSFEIIVFEIIFQEYKQCAIKYGSS